MIPRSPGRYLRSAKPTDSRRGQILLQTVDMFSPELTLLPFLGPTRLAWTRRSSAAGGHVADWALSEGH